MGHNIVWPDFQGLLVKGNRLVQLPLCGKRVPQTVISLGKAGVQPDNLLKLMDSLVHAPLREPGAPKTVMSVVIILCHRNRPLPNTDIILPVTKLMARQHDAGQNQHPASSA